MMYTAFLTHKGRFLFDTFLLHRHNSNSEEAAAEDDSTEILIDVHQQFAETFPKHINKYKLRSQVQLQDVSSGTQVSAIMSSFPHEIDNIRFHLEKHGENVGVLGVAPDPRTPFLGLRVLHAAGAKAELADSVRKALDGAIVRIDGEDVYERQRFWLGIPEAPNELVSEKSLPLESNLQWLNAISYTKGCYLGQELTARTHYKGVIRKRIVPFIVSSTSSDHDSAVDLPLRAYCPQSLCTAGSHLPADVADLSIIDTEEAAAGEVEIGKVLSVGASGRVVMGLARVEAVFKRSRLSLRSEDEMLKSLVVSPFIPNWWPFNDK
eukprot:TRINITY_DN6230_c0_g1_i1.p1 TRINITY_DN6230_c0_g1~~TRINITY_DN6230_c0_g1_i1.p1  ORF type:complete len:322 (+),score=81.04 TRINITY_DN6230_c0_g1_i1:3-968(+)